jgi:hypothetical protein
MPPFLAADIAAEKAKDYELNKSRKDTLRPGIYGDVGLEDLSTLFLKPGIYHMKSLSLGKSAQLLFTGVGQIQIRIRRGLTTDENSSFKPAQGSSVRPQDVCVYVSGASASSSTRFSSSSVKYLSTSGENLGGTNAQTQTTLSVSIGKQSTMSANVYAPNGITNLNQGVIATGAFFGKVVIVGPGVQLSLASAFSSATFAKVAQEIPEEPAEKKTDLPTAFALMQNYPNPFNPTTSIRYAIPALSHVTLSIYNIVGQEVIRLVDRTESQGYYQVQWNGKNSFGNDIASGLYFYRITAGEFVDVKKLLFVK